MGGEARISGVFRSIRRSDCVEHSMNKSEKNMADREDWYWAAGNDGAAKDRFVIAHGQEELWGRVRREIDPDERYVTHGRVHRGTQAEIGDILDLFLVVALMHRVNQNRFVIEAAQIPVFAKFLRSARHDLCNYVSNPTNSAELIPVERYDDAVKRRLGKAVSRTLALEPDWYLG